MDTQEQEQPTTTKTDQKLRDDERYVPIRTGICIPVSAPLAEVQQYPGCDYTVWIGDSNFQESKRIVGQYADVDEAIEHAKRVVQEIVEWMVENPGFQEMIQDL